MSIDVVKITHPQTFGFVVGDLVVLKEPCVFLRETESTRIPMQKFLCAHYVRNVGNKDVRFFKIRPSPGTKFLILSCIEIMYNESLDYDLRIRTKIDKIITLLDISTSSKIDLYLDLSCMSIDKLFEKVNEDL